MRRAEQTAGGPWPRRRPEVEAAFYGICILVVVVAAGWRFVIEPWVASL